MTQITGWLHAFIKRIFGQKRMFALLLLFPLLCGGIRAYTSHRESLIRVALYQEEASELSSETIAQLTHTTGIVSFYEVSSKEALYRAVENTSAECGYIFTKQYQTEHLLDASLWKKSVQVVQSPSSSLSGSINELVFSVFFQQYNKELLHQYLSGDKILKKGEDQQAMLRDADALFETHCTDGSTFSFAEQTTGSSDDASQTETSSYTDIFLSNAARGILAILLMLCAMSGGVYLGRDQRKLFVMPMHPRMRCIIQFLDVLVPTLLMAASGILGICILPAHQPLYTELAALVLYSILLSGFVCFIRTFVRSELFFSMLIPLLSLAGLVLSPVFMDTAAYLPVLTIPKYLLPSTYYLEAVTSGLMAVLRLVIAAVILTTATAILWRKTASKRSSHTES